MRKPKYKYRVKVYETNGYKKWYMPQYKRNKWWGMWNNISRSVPFGDLGFRTYDEAIKRIKVEKILDEFIQESVDNLTIKKTKTIEII